MTCRRIVVVQSAELPRYLYTRQVRVATGSAKKPCSLFIILVSTLSRLMDDSAILTVLIVPIGKFWFDRPRVIGEAQCNDLE